MYGALGGATVFGMILQKEGPRGGVILMWLLFALVVSAHEVGVPAI